MAHLFTPRPRKTALPLVIFMLPRNVFLTADQERQGGRALTFHLPPPPLIRRTGPAVLFIIAPEADIRS